MNKTKEKLFWVLTLVLCVLLFACRLTGEIVHAVLGIVLTVMMIVHTCRQMGKMKRRKASFRLVDYALIVLLLAVFVTGMLQHPMHGVLAVKILHKLSAVLFVIGILAHALQHRAAFRK